MRVTTRRVAYAAFGALCFFAGLLMPLTLLNVSAVVVGIATFTWGMNR